MRALTAIMFLLITSYSSIEAQDGDIGKESTSQGTKIYSISFLILIMD